MTLGYNLETREFSVLWVTQPHYLQIKRGWHCFSDRSYFLDNIRKLVRLGFSPHPRELSFSFLQQSHSGLNAPLDTLRHRPLCPADSAPGAIFRLYRFNFIIMMACLAGTKDSVEPAHTQGWLESNPDSSTLWFYPPEPSLSLWISISPVLPEKWGQYTQPPEKCWLDLNGLTSEKGWTILMVRLLTAT